MSEDDDRIMAVSALFLLLPVIRGRIQEGEGNKRDLSHDEIIPI